MTSSTRNFATDRAAVRHHARQSGTPALEVDALTIVHRGRRGTARLTDAVSLRVWPDYAAIVDTCCQAWNALMAMPDRIASITRREWARPVTG